jgi:uracil-DNA glycosylase family 4
LTDAFVTAPVRCAPPGNQPTPIERDTCSQWFDAELDLLPNAKVFVVLGQFAYHAMWSRLRRRGMTLPRPRPVFSHGAEVDVGGSAIVMSYHVSQQNTFTGRLTEAMLDGVFARAVERATT